MVQIVINRDYGYFGLSHEALLRYAEIKGLNLVFEPLGGFEGVYNYYLDQVKDENLFWEQDIPRDDTALVQVVGELGDRASSDGARLKIVTVPDGVDWYIQEHDGMEWIAERHRTWF